MGVKGHRHTPEARAKMSAALMGNKHALGSKRSEEQRAAMKGKRYALGSKRTEEHRAKMSAALKGRSPSLEARAKMSAMRIGKKHSPETRAKLKLAAQRRKKGLDNYKNCVFDVIKSSRLEV